MVFKRADYGLVVILLIIMAIYSPYLSRQVTYDEAYTFLNYAPSPLTALLLYTTPNNHLLHSLFVWLTTSSVGDSLLAIRLPAFFASLLSIAYIYRIGRRMFSPNAGLIAAVMLAAVPMIMDHLVTARGYSLSILVALLFFDMIVCRFPYPRHSPLLRRYHFMALVVLLMIVLPTLLLLTIPVCAWLLLQLFRRGEYTLIREYLAQFAFGTVIGVMFYTSGFLLDGLNRFSDQFGFDDVGALTAGLIDRTTTPLLWPVLMIGLVAGIRYAWLRQRDFIEVVGIMVGTAIVLALIQQWFTGGVLFPRNYIYLVPFVVLLVAVGWAGLFMQLPYSNIMTLALMAVLLVGIVDRVSVLGRETTFDEVEMAINQNIQANDALLTQCCLDAPLQYIYRETSFTTIDETTQRIIVIPTRYFSFEQIKAELEHDPTCIREQWLGVEVHICPATTATAAPVP